MTATTPRHRPLTPHMRTALRAARSQPLRRVHDDTPGKPSWPANPNTIYALWRNGALVGSCRLSRRGRPIEEWHITDLGVEALKPRLVVRRDTVTRLRCGRGSTRVMQFGVWVDVRMPEPEAMRLAA